MKRVIAGFLAVVAICASLCACSSNNHEDWHNRQVQKGMNEAKRILGK